MGVFKTTSIQTDVPEETKKDSKLSPKYYGPYKLLQNIGSMAYKLELPTSSGIHPVFHVSCLNKVIGEKLPIQMIYHNLMGKKTHLPSWRNH